MYFSPARARTGFNYFVEVTELADGSVDLRRFVIFRCWRACYVGWWKMQRWESIFIPAQRGGGGGGGWGGGGGGGNENVSELRKVERYSRVLENPRREREICGELF